jgi:hypothetical protein
MASFRLMGPSPGAIASTHATGAARQLAPAAHFHVAAAPVVGHCLKISTRQASRGKPLRAAVAAPSSPSSNSAKLPWQAAMSEIKKRKDLKTIMIIGAGPIVIGQVRHRPGPGGAARRARREEAAIGPRCVRAAAAGWARRPRGP